MKTRPQTITLDIEQVKLALARIISGSEVTGVRASYVAECIIDGEGELYPKTPNPWKGEISPTNSSSEEVAVYAARALGFPTKRGRIDPEED